MKKYIKNGELYNGKFIVVGDMQIVNPSEEVLIENGWEEFVEPVPTDEERTETARAARFAEIESYDQSEAVNQFTLGGVPMWLDASTRAALRISVLAYKETGRDNVTKVFGGQEYAMPVDTWLQMLNALEVYASEALNVTERHKAAVGALATEEEIMGYDITAGYPQKLVFG